MADIRFSANEAELQAWTIFNLLSLLHAVIDDDRPDGLPIKCVLGHIMELAQALPDRIESLASEAHHG